MELKDLTFYDVLQLDIFRDELAEQLTREMMAVEKANTKGKLRRMAMDSLMEKNVFNVQNMTSMFYLIKHKELKNYSANERQYINDVCQMAYQRTILQLKEESEATDRNPLLRWVLQFHAWIVQKFKKGGTA